MADIRPFRSLHFNENDVSPFLCPPYDVISAAAQRRLYESAPLNIIRLELGEAHGNDTTSNNRYTRAATTLQEWLASGALVRDDDPAFYLHDQQFSYDDRTLTRRNLFVRLRLHEWQEGIVRPHEHTLSLPKEDRLRLLRACRVNFSSILALYDDRDQAVRKSLEQARSGSPPLETATLNGEKHSVYRIDDAAAQATIARLFENKTIYVIDGHHRYETALNYLKERKSHKRRWSGEEGENFVLAALVTHDDPGLVVMPTHRLLAGTISPTELVRRLREVFAFEELPTNLPWQDIEARLSTSTTQTVRFAFANRDRLFMLTFPESSEDLMAKCPSSWRSLDAAVLQEVVFHHMLDIDQQTATAEGLLEFEYDGEEALRLVRSGRYAFGFLLSATPPQRVMEVADAGERMPQKSTYFYPKLPTGLVMNPLY